MKAHAVLMAIAAVAGALVMWSVPADARGRCCGAWSPQPSPRYYQERYYRAPPSSTRRYRADPCGYGNCACIRSYALSTGSQVWWDRYQACTGG